MTCGVHLQCSEVLLQLLAIGLSNGAIIALNAIGVTLIYGAVRTINFAYGDLFALTSIVITTLITALGLRASREYRIMRFVVVTKWFTGLGFAIRLQDEGHDVETGHQTAQVVGRQRRQQIV